MRAFLILALLPIAALAQDPSRVYVVAGAGSAMVLGVGWTATNHWSIEAGYAGFGQLDTAETQSGSTRTNEKWESSGFGGKAIYSAKVSRYLSMQGSAGAYRMSTTHTTDTYSRPPLFVAYVKTGSGSEESQKIVPTLGFATAYELSKWSAMRLAFDRFGSPAPGADPINSVSLVAMARF